MDFELVFKHVIQPFEEEDIQYGLIGGFALGVMGILRSTIDIDFLILVDDLEKAENVLSSAMYSCIYKTENISQYSSSIKTLGHIDIIHAFRHLAREMLTRVQSFTVFDQYSVKVLFPEDIIGLKVQAIANEPSRHAADFQDIRLLLKYKKMNQQNVDWELLEDYFDLFNKQNLLVQLRNEFS